MQIGPCGFLLIYYSAFVLLRVSVFGCASSAAYMSLYVCLYASLYTYAFVSGFFFRDQIIMAYNYYYIRHLLSPTI